MSKKIRKVDYSVDSFKKKESSRATHGLSSHALYYVWLAIKSRCEVATSKQFKDYGGRGIKLCKEWQDVSSFFEWSINNGYQKGKELDRVETNGNYEPSNCRWTSHFQNQRNRRTTILYEYQGQKKSMAEWSATLDIPYTKLNYYVNIKKMPFELAVKNNCNFKKVRNTEQDVKNGASVRYVIKECGLKQSSIVNKLLKLGFTISDSQFSNKLGGTRDFFTDSELVSINRILEQYVS